jgi:hypothetical protein
MPFRLAVIFLLMMTTAMPAHAFLWGLLGRGMVTRGAIGAAERSALMRASAGSRMAVGQVNRGNANAGNLAWLGQGLTRNAIESTVRSNGAMVQNLGQVNCLTVEFDGYGNYMANHCVTSVAIRSILQQDAVSGQLFQSNCVDCSILPYQMMYFAPAQVSGPFVAVESAENPSSIQSSGGQLESRAVRTTWSDKGVSMIAEVRNDTAVAQGIVVDTHSIWGLTKAEIFNACGGSYVQSPPYDSFSGISKSPEAPTWIPPGGKISITYRPNSLRGSACKLSHAVIDAYVFREGNAYGQPQPLVITLDQ